jgi:hypothetical protein
VSAGKELKRDSGGYFPYGTPYGPQTDQASGFMLLQFSDGSSGGLMSDACSATRIRDQVEHSVPQGVMLEADRPLSKFLKDYERSLRLRLASRI